MLRHNALHVVLVVDKASPVAEGNPSGLADVLLEAAVTTIADCEDSVAAVDAADKARVYSNWAGLMRGDLTCEFQKGGKTVTRALAADRVFTTPDGEGSLVLPGRSLLLIRNVGIHMYTDAVLDRSGQEVPEGSTSTRLTPPFRSPTCPPASW